MTQIKHLEIFQAKKVLHLLVTVHFHGSFHTSFHHANSFFNFFFFFGKNVKSSFSSCQSILVFSFRYIIVKFCVLHYCEILCAPLILFDVVLCPIKYVYTINGK